MENAVVLIILLIMLLIGVFVRASREMRVARIIREWAAQNGEEVLSIEQRYARRGPFASTRSKAQQVARIRTQASNGATRTGWVRVALNTIVQDTPSVEVIWD